MPAYADGDTPLLMMMAVEDVFAGLMQVVDARGRESAAPHTVDIVRRTMPIEDNDC